MQGHLTLHMGRSAHQGIIFKVLCLKKGIHRVIPPNHLLSSALDYIIFADMCTFILNVSKCKLHIVPFLWFSIQ